MVGFASSRNCFKGDIVKIRCSNSIVGIKPSITKEYQILSVSKGKALINSTPSVFIDTKDLIPVSSINYFKVNTRVKIIDSKKYTNTVGTVISHEKRSCIIQLSTGQLVKIKPYYLVRI